MKQKLFIFTKIALAAILLFSLPVSANTFNWYVMPNSAHTQPPLPAEFAAIGEHGGVYLDTAHGDGNPEKVIYLTFDAGYENGNVEKILDVLKKHGATATFFILEHLVRANTDLVCRMFEDGHIVANHTCSHKNMAGADKSCFEAELLGLEALCRELTGHEMARLYRPPEGSFAISDLEIAKSLGFTSVFWSAAYADWDNQNQPDPEKSLSKLLSRLHNGEILLLHPTSATNAAILDEFLAKLEADGWTFGKLTDLGG